MTKNLIDFSAGDDLSDMLSGNAAAPRALPQDEQLARIRDHGIGLAPTAKPFQVTCPKCSGRGRFVSYGGRDCGPCYTCKGTGKLERKTAPAQLERAKERRIAQKDALRDEAEPQIKWLKSKLSRRGHLPDGYANLLADLLKRLEAGRTLSEGQMAVIEKGQARDAEYAARRASEAQERVQAASVVEVSLIVDAFQRAQEAGLKRFTLRFADVHFQVDRNDPTLIWISQGGYGTAKYGRIAGGAFRPGRDANAQVISLIAKIAADPMAAALAYAQVTSSCSVCGRHLENQDSVDAGIGPVCAGRLNRPGLKFVAVKAGDF